MGRGRCVPEGQPPHPVLPPTGLSAEPQALCRSHLLCGQATPQRPRCLPVGRCPAQSPGVQPPTALVSEAAQLGEGAWDPRWPPLTPPSPRSHLSLLVRPRAPHGLLLFAAPRKAGGPSLLLFLSKGYFIARIEGAGIRHRHIQSHQKARMGRWHMVRTAEGEVVPAWQSGTASPASLRIGFCEMGQDRGPSGHPPGQGPASTQSAPPLARLTQAQHTLYWGPPCRQP